MQVEADDRSQHGRRCHEHGRLDGIQAVSQPVGQRVEEEQRTHRPSGVGDEPFDGDDALDHEVAAPTFDGPPQLRIVEGDVIGQAWVGWIVDPLVPLVHPETLAPSELHEARR